MGGPDTTHPDNTSRSTKRTNGEGLADDKTQDKKASLVTSEALLKIQGSSKLSKPGKQETSASTHRDISPSADDIKIRAGSDGNNCNFCKAPFKAQFCANIFGSIADPSDCTICRGIQAIIYNCERDANLKEQNARAEITTMYALEQQKEIQKYLSDIDALMFKHLKELAAAKADARQTWEALAVAESTVYALQEQFEEATAPKDDNAYWLQAESHRAQLLYMQKELASLQKQAGDRIAEEKVANVVFLDNYNASENLRKEMYQLFRRYRDETDERIAALSEENAILRQDNEEAWRRLNAYHQADKENTITPEAKHVLHMRESNRPTVSEPLGASGHSDIVKESTASSDYLGMIANLNSLRLQYEDMAEMAENTNKEILRRRAELDELQRSLSHLN